MRLQMFLQSLLQRQLLRFVKNAPQKIMCPFAMCPINQIRTLRCQCFQGRLEPLRLQKPQECTTEDHVSVCHVPHPPNSDFAVSVLSRPTGTTAVTETSRPVLKNKSLEFSSHTNTTSP